MALSGQRSAFWEETTHQAPCQWHYTLDCRLDSFRVEVWGGGLETSVALEQSRAWDLEARRTKFNLREIPESQLPPTEQVTSSL